ncbi:MAG: hypothetical protein LBV72_13160 [Tannerella sp.]|jgi:hypothetical protein|nr:hypothetical protein [Tannerella sp.]
MKIISRLFFLILLLTITSCDKDDEIFSDTANKLIGAWMPVDSDDFYDVYERVDLLDHEYGMEFKSKGKFVNRLPATWCGTPPVAFADYKGSWTEKDSIINATYEFWNNEKRECTWRIISVDERYLILSPVMIQD